MDAFEHKGESTFLEQEKYKLVILSFEAWATVSGFPAQKLPLRFYKQEIQSSGFAALLRATRSSSSFRKGVPPLSPGSASSTRRSLLSSQTGAALGRHSSKCFCPPSECGEGTYKGNDLGEAAPQLWGVCSGVVPPAVQVSHHNLPATCVLGLLLLQLLQITQIS